MLKTISLKEDLTFNNLKLLFGFACCAFALIAQFYPKPFPDNKTVLIICCSSYIVVSAIMQIVATFFESDIILRTKSFGKSKSIVIRTQLPRFQDIYTVSYEYNGQPASKVELKSSVTSWFDSNGVFSQETFFKDLASLHSKLQQKKNA